MTAAVLRLAGANVVARRTRLALVIASVALSVALVVAITSGYASVERVLRGFVEDFIGSVDFEVTAPQEHVPSISSELVESIRSDPRVAKVTSRIELFATPIDAAGDPMPNGRMMIYGLDSDPSSLGRTPKLEGGRFLNPGERNAIVVDQNTMAELKLKLGDTLRFDGPHGELKSTIVGVLHRPTLLRAFLKTAYLPIDDARAFVAPDRPGYVSKLRGEFKPSIDANAFVGEWKPKIDAEKATLTRTRDSRATLDRNLIVLRLASYLASSVGMGAAAFIILATMMTGVQEQHRQLAMLRAVGATRRQVAMLVALEGLSIGFFGALVGVPLGALSIYALSWIFPDVFESGVSIDAVGMVYAAGVAMVAAFVASLWPAIQASRARPIEAMAESSRPPPRLSWPLLAAGAILASLDTLIILSPLERLGPAAVQIRLVGHVLLGLPGLLLGALFLAPLLIVAIEAIGSRVLGVLLRVPRDLLRQQLSESTFRSAATGVALMIGLMLLITMNAQARSALSAWKIPDRFPDVFIVPDTVAGTMSIRAKEVEAIKQLPELKSDRVMPISVTAPTLGQQIFDVSGPKLPDKTLFIGIDPVIGFDLMELDFLGDSPDENARRQATAQRMMEKGRAITLNDGTVLQGTIERSSDVSLDLLLLDGSRRSLPTSAIKRNEKGRYLIVTNEFRKLRGFDVGSPFSLDAGIFGSRKVEFTIVGVVWSPGLDVMLNTFDLPARVREQTAATVFGTLEDGRNVFFIRDAFLIAANTKLGVSREDLASAVRKAVGHGGVDVKDVRQLKHSIESTFSRVIRFASGIAWAAMVVASVGVANAIVAAVRTRQWRLGVLRAIGLTRGELGRLLVAEAIMLCLVGAALGAGFGLLLSFNANRLYASAIGFAPKLVLPWSIVWAGVVVVLLLGVLATMGPAIAAARRTPLSLLQAGRGAS